MRARAVPLLLVCTFVLILAGAAAAAPGNGNGPSSAPFQTDAEAEELEDRLEENDSAQQAQINDNRAGIDILFATLSSVADLYQVDSFFDVFLTINARINGLEARVTDLEDRVDALEAADGGNGDDTGVCSTGDTRPCGLTDVGACKFGIQTCTDGLWGACEGEVGPSPEVCDDVDNNCDGIVDDGNVCVETTTYEGTGTITISGLVSETFDVTILREGSEVTVTLVGDVIGTVTTSGTIPGDTFTVILPVDTAGCTGEATLDMTFTDELVEGELSGEATCSGLTFTVDGEMSATAVDADPQTVSALSPGDLVINEIMVNPEFNTDVEGEWFEIYNTRLTPVDLNGLVINSNPLLVQYADDDGVIAFGNETLLGNLTRLDERYVVDESVVVPGNRYVVLARNGDPATNCGITPGHTYEGGIAFAASDIVAIGFGTTEIDRVVWRDGDLAFSGPGQSAELSTARQDATANDDPTAWCAATLSMSCGDLGTPGVENACVA